MPSATYKDAIKEAYAVAPTDVVVLNTLELSHSVAGTKRIVSNTSDISASIEGPAGPYTFTATPWAFNYPESGAAGTQRLQVQIDNVDREASDYVDEALGVAEPIIAKWRPYLANDLSEPQVDPPLTLYIRKTKTNLFQVDGEASFADIVNRTFLNDLFSSDRFPSLALA